MPCSNDVALTWPGTSTFPARNRRRGAGAGLPLSRRPRTMRRVATEARRFLRRGSKDAVYQDIVYRIVPENRAQPVHDTNPAPENTPVPVQGVGPGL